MDININFSQKELYLIAEALRLGAIHSQTSGQSDSMAELSNRITHIIKIKQQFNGK
jgi:hypothetical protein